MRLDPLIVETLRGLRGCGSLQAGWLNAMALQALVLLLWWPKREFYESLQRHSGPDTLYAVLLVVGVTLAWQALRTGAEELALPGQQSLREWALVTALPGWRLTLGQAGAQLLQASHALALSAPLLLVAASVSGATPSVAGWALSMLLAQALALRLAVAWLYLRIGHLGTLTFLLSRGVFIAVYVVALLWVPLLSLPRVARGLLDTGAGSAAVLAHVGLWLAVALLAGVGLSRALALSRRIADTAAARPG